MSPNYRFRKLKVWSVRNRILFGLIMSSGFTIKQCAERLGVSARSVQRWVYIGIIPTEENIEKLEQLFKVPEYIMFYEINNCITL